MKTQTTFLVSNPAALGQYESKPKEGNTDISHELLSFLKNWLTKHIMGVDQKYASFLRKKMGN